MDALHAEETGIWQRQNIRLAEVMAALSIATDLGMG